MSIRVMDLVFKTRLPAPEKLLLLALADWSNDSGKSCFGSVNSMSLKTSQSRRTVFRQLLKLRISNTLSKVSVKDNGIVVYTINLKKLTGAILSPVPFCHPPRVKVALPIKEEPSVNRQYPPVPSIPAPEAGAHVWQRLVEIAFNRETEPELPMMETWERGVLDSVGSFYAIRKSKNIARLRYDFLHQWEHERRHQVKLASLTKAAEAYLVKHARATVGANGGKVL